MLAQRHRGILALEAAIQTLLVWALLWGMERVLAGGASASGGIFWVRRSLPWAMGIGVEALWWGHSGFGTRHEGHGTPWGRAMSRALGASLFPAMACLGAFGEAGMSERASGWGEGALGWTLGGGVCGWVGLGAAWLWLSVLHRVLPRSLREEVLGCAHRQRAVLIGSSEEVRRLERDIQTWARWGIEPVGWIPCEEEGDGWRGASGHHAACMGRLEELEPIAIREQVQQVILVGEAPRPWQLEAVAHTCDRLGLRFLVVQKLEPLPEARVDRDWEVLGRWRIRSVYQEPLQNPACRAIKRAVDVVLALGAVLLILLPLALMTYGMQRRQSPGPLFCRQWRHGRGQRAFLIWKFRTMHADAGDVARQASCGDVRVFPFGRFLRKHSLDEFPQVLNVLCGQMSIVGPRPHLVQHTERFAQEPRYHIRSFVKPGMTGLAQIHGCRGELRSPEDLRRRVEWDIRYVESWSLILDFWIIGRTFREVWCPSSRAY
ncbi:MAG: hypothetical protein RLZZ142_283 [Verrucomicrobiota bacterium]